MVSPSIAIDVFRRDGFLGLIFSLISVGLVASVSGVGGVLGGSDNTPDLAASISSIVGGGQARDGF